MFGLIFGHVENFDVEGCVCLSIFSEFVLAFLGVYTYCSVSVLLSSWVTVAVLRLLATCQLLLCISPDPRQHLQNHCQLEVLLCCSLET